MYRMAASIELYVLTSALLPEAEISEYIDIEIERKMDTYSQLILRVEGTKRNNLLLGTGKILVTKDDPAYGYIIQHIEFTQVNGENLLEVVAFSLNYLLSFRHIYPQQVFYGTNEEAIRYFVTNNLISPSQANRKIDNFILGQINNIGTTDTYSNSGGNLLEFCMQLANEAGGTIDVYVDHNTRKFVMEIVRGLDRSADQSVNPRVVFSEEYDNVLQQNYFRSLINYRNAAIIAGEGEGIDRVIVDQNNRSGLDRRELFVDARDLQSTYKDDDDNDITLTPQQYTNTLLSRGNNQLLEVRQTETFESVVDDRQYVYGRDYFLGDIVSIKSDELNIIAHVPVYSVKITSNENGVTVVPSLGTGLPSIFNRGVLR